MERCIIYLLKNTVNGKVYVGQTWQSLKKRFSQGYKSGTHIGNAIKLYGKEKFYYEILALASNQEIADYLEDFYIKNYRSKDREYGYNLADGGSVRRHSPESIEKMSITQKEHYSNHPERRQKASDQKMGALNPNFGKKLSNDQKVALLLANSLSIDLIEELNRLYDLGHSMNKISKLLNITRSTIRKYVVNKR